MIIHTVNCLKEFNFGMDETYKITARSALSRDAIYDVMRAHLDSISSENLKLERLSDFFECHEDSATVEMVFGAAPEIEHNLPIEGLLFRKAREEAEKSEQTQVEVFRKYHIYDLQKIDPPKIH